MNFREEKRPGEETAASATSDRGGTTTSEASGSGSTSSELLLLPDGRILAHNITPAMAALLADMDPANADIRSRVRKTPRESGE